MPLHANYEFASDELPMIDEEFDLFDPEAQLDISAEASSTALDENELDLLFLQ